MVPLLVLLILSRVSAFRWRLGLEHPRRLPSSVWNVVQVGGTLAQLGCWRSWASPFFPCRLRTSLSPQGLSRRVARHLRWQLKAPTSAKVEAVSHFCHIPLVKVGRHARQIQCGRVWAGVWICRHMVHWGPFWRVATTRGDTVYWGQKTGWGTGLRKGELLS